jgi:hypothetical protein
MTNYTLRVGDRLGLSFLPVGALRDRHRMRLRVGEALGVDESPRCLDFEQGKLL